MFTKLKPTWTKNSRTEALHSSLVLVMVLVILVLLVLALVVVVATLAPREGWEGGEG